MRWPRQFATSRSLRRRTQRSEFCGVGSWGGEGWGRMTEARRVRLKNYFGIGRPSQSQYISFANIDWDQRDAHELSDVSPTETGRRFVADPLSPQQLSVVVSPQQSLYFIARLDYCDIYGECRYFIRCAELGNRPQIVTYCGTRVGDLSDDVNAEQP